VRGDKFEELVKASEDSALFECRRCSGVEQLKSDFETSKPEIVFNIDRERANREGISTAQIGMEIRNAVFGNEVSQIQR
jgi:multidrug efflux pump